MQNTHEGHVTSDSGTAESLAAKRMPIEVSRADAVFGGRLKDILPPMAEIPDEFKRDSGQWVAWQQEWFFRGLERLPAPREGIDLHMAMNNLACIQGSFEPKHEHKQAGVAYLASLWFSSPDGEPIKKAATGAPS